MRPILGAPGVRGGKDIVVVGERREGLGALLYSRCIRTKRKVAEQVTAPAAFS